MIKTLLIMLSLLPFIAMAQKNIVINGYYHIEKDVDLSIPERLKVEMKRVNDLLTLHQIDGFTFSLGEVKGLNTNSSTFYDETEGSESFIAYKAIKSDLSNQQQLDFYVRFERPNENSKVKGVAVQGGSYFAALLDPEDRFDTFSHELLHMLGLGDVKASYGSPYICEAKYTIMNERVLPRESKVMVLSDPRITKNGVACGHSTHYDNARLLSEILHQRFKLKTDS